HPGLHTAHEPKNVPASPSWILEDAQPCRRLEHQHEGGLRVLEAARVDGAEAVGVLEDELPELAVILPPRRLDGDVELFTPLQPIFEEDADLRRVRDHFQAPEADRSLVSIPKHVDVGK